MNTTEKLPAFLNHVLLFIDNTFYLLIETRKITHKFYQLMKSCFLNYIIIIIITKIKT